MTNRILKSLNLSALCLTIICLIFASQVRPAYANDPDGIHDICEKRMNKYSASTNCDCIVEKYYPKKQELEQLYGVPLESDSVLPHLQNSCHNVSATGDVEYKICMESNTFDGSAKGLDRDAFCTCYAQEWEKELAAYDGPTLDKNARRHLKGSARATCKNKLH